MYELEKLAKVHWNWGGGGSIKIKMTSLVGRAWLLLLLLYRPGISECQTGNWNWAQVAVFWLMACLTGKFCTQITMRFKLVLW